MGFGLQSRLQGPLTAGRAPDFELQTFSGESLRLSDYRGRVVLVNIWASWCVPCRDEAPLLQEAYRTWKDEGLMVIGVNWVDTEPKAREFIQEFGLTYPNGPDVGQGIARAFRMQGIPETYVIDPDGNVVYAHIGPLTRRVLEERVLPLLEGER